VYWENTMVSLGKGKYDVGGQGLGSRYLGIDYKEQRDIKYKGSDGFDVRRD
jgi:hypothetical protein